MATTETKSMTTAEIIALDEKYGAHNYHPLPVVISEGRGHLGDGSGGQATTSTACRPIPPSTRATATRASSRP